MTGIIAATLDRYAKSSSKIFSHDRLNTVGASEVGQCARKIFWLKNEGDAQYGAPRDPEYIDSWGARMRGTVFEDAFWEPAMRARFGNRLKFAGRAVSQKTFVADFLSATPDGIITDFQRRGGENRRSRTEADCRARWGVWKTGFDPRTNLAEAKAGQRLPNPGPDGPGARDDGSMQADAQRAVLHRCPHSGTRSASL